MKCEIAVVGAGPGGSTAAFFLAKAGIDVLLVDRKKFPRDKPCGDGQVRSIHPLFREMGIYEAIRKQARVLHGAAIGAPSGAYHSFATPDREMFCTPRIIIDDIIRRAAVDQGARFVEEFTATELVMEKRRVTGLRGHHRKKSAHITSDAVVVADGAMSRLSLQLGFRNARPHPDYLCFGTRGYFDNVRGMTDTLDFIYPSASLFPAGYFWIFPVTEMRANVGVYITAAVLRRTGRRIQDYIPWFRDNTVIGQERLGGAKQAGPLKGSLLPTYPLARENYCDGAVVVGDAGSMIEPLFGAGLPQAMTSGKIAAEVITEALRKGDVSATTLSLYRKRVDEEMGPTYALQSLVREHLFTRPEDLNAFIDCVRRGDDPDLAGRGANETIALYLMKYKGVKLL